MIIKFKDGHKIEFKKYGNIWLADSVIWEDTKLNGSLDKLRKLKVKVSQWFNENAPDGILEKYNARLPLFNEVDNLPLKDRFAYKEGRPYQIADYFLGDEEPVRPVYSGVGDCDIYTGTFYRGGGEGRSYSYIGAVRLCLEEKK